MRKVKPISKKTKRKLMLLFLETTSLIGFVVAVIMFVIRLRDIANGNVPTGMERLWQDITAVFFAVGALLSHLSLACLTCE